MANFIYTLIVTYGANPPTSSFTYDKIASAYTAGIDRSTYDGYSGCYFWLHNDSDVGIVITYDTSKSSFLIPPSTKMVVPIPYGDYKFTTTAQYTNIHQNSNKSSVLLVVFLTLADIKAGWVLDSGSVLNPSPAATQLAPGALPSGVTLAGNQLTGDIVAPSGHNLVGDTTAGKGLLLDGGGTLSHGLHAYKVFAGTGPQTITHGMDAAPTFFTAISNQAVAAVVGVNNVNATTFDIVCAGGVVWIATASIHF